MKQTIHSRKVFIHFRSGVKILDCATMKWKIIRNKDYSKVKLEKLLGLQNKFKVKAK